tara:strand:+ start:3510 stop:3971 length:462 start_codon:yes stop_codon:yes gene_type:complete
MKASEILTQKARDWLILGGKLVTRILEDTNKGISQDGNGRTKDFPSYTIDYALKKVKGIKTKKGLSKSRQVSPPNLKLTGVMLNSLKAQKPTSSSVELNYRDGLKFEGNAKRGRNVYGLNDKNEAFVKEYFEKIIDDRIIKFNKKDIIINLKV